MAQTQLRLDTASQSQPPLLQYMGHCVVRSGTHLQQYICHATCCGNTRPISSRRRCVATGYMKNIPIYNHGLSA